MARSAPTLNDARNTVDKKCFLCRIDVGEIRDKGAVMKRTFIFAAAVAASLALSASPAFADMQEKSIDAATILKDYVDNAELFAVGMCDGDRSTLVVLVGTGYRVIRFDPVADPTKRFYVITEQNGSHWIFKDHFIVDLPQNTPLGEERVRQVSHYALSVEVGHLSDNFYPWVRGSGIDPSDCDVSLTKQ